MSQKENMGSITTQVIEEVSEDSSQSNYSYLYECAPSILKTTKKKGQSSKVSEYKNLRVQSLLKEIVTEAFIQAVCEFFPTKELVSRVRPLNKSFN